MSLVEENGRGSPHSATRPQELCFLPTNRQTVPKKTAINRARADKRAGKKPSVQAGEFIREEMHALKKGTSNHVRSRQQAIAIGLSEARRAGIVVGLSKGSRAR
jgi:hypothetical protein